VIVLHPKPDEVVQVRALDVPEHDGIVSAVGEAEVPAAFPTTVFAVWEAREARAIFDSVLFEPLIVLLVKVCVPASVTTFDARIFASAKVQITPDVEHSTRSPFVGAVAKKATVLLAVAELFSVVEKAAALSARITSPATLPATPNVGVAVQLAAEELVALGTVPAAALVAFVPPWAIVALASQPNNPPEVVVAKPAVAQAVSVKALNVPAAAAVPPMAGGDAR
jgi:hypothetical protein